MDHLKLAPYAGSFLFTKAISLYVDRINGLCIYSIATGFSKSKEGAKCQFATVVLQTSPKRISPIGGKCWGYGKKVCRECRKIENDQWYQRHKEKHLENVKALKSENRTSARDFAWDYLAAHPCEICGEWDPIVLEFHH